MISRLDDELIGRYPATPHPDESHRGRSRPSASTARGSGRGLPFRSAERGITTAVPTGTYGVKVALLASSGATLSETDAKTVVVTGNERALLPVVRFEIE